jgi:hypothetical protein
MSKSRMMTILTLETSENENNSVFPWGPWLGFARNCYLSVLVHDDQILAAAPSYRSLPKRTRLYQRYSHYLCLEMVMIMMHIPRKFVCLLQSFRDLSEITRVGMD